MDYAPSTHIVGWAIPSSQMHTNMFLSFVKLVYECWLFYHIFKNAAEASSIYHWTLSCIFTLSASCSLPRPLWHHSNRAVINVHGLSKTAHLWCCLQCLDNSQASINTKLHQVHLFSCWIFRASHWGGYTGFLPAFALLPCPLCHYATLEPFRFLPGGWNLVGTPGGFELMNGSYWTWIHLRVEISQLLHSDNLRQPEDAFRMLNIECTERNKLCPLQKEVLWTPTWIMDRESPHLVTEIKMWAPDWFCQHQTEP